MKAVILIPARLDSSRLEKKMLADLCGEPLIVRTWRQALKSRLAERVVVATDSLEIAAVLEERGAEVVMTSLKPVAAPNVSLRRQGRSGEMSFLICRR